MRSKMMNYEKTKEFLKRRKRFYKFYKYSKNETFLLKVASCKFNRKYYEGAEDIKKLKDIHKGQRCFIIGNGPSLTLHDLDAVKNEITFASNKIHSVFDEVSFRPTYYFSQDEKVLLQLFDESPNVFDRINARQVFLPVDVKMMGIPYKEGITYFYITRRNSYPNQPRFSKDVSRVVHEGMTVTYSEMQFALYMGFKEIYLIGVDHNYANVIMPDGTVVQKDGVKDYFSEKYKYKVPMNPANIIMSELAYKSANEYANKNGAKIYNATRGGKLEVFERIDFDGLKLE